MPEYYTMRVFCKNCETYSNIEIEKGIEKEEIIDDAECSHCGVEGYLKFD